MEAVQSLSGAAIGTMPGPDGAAALLFHGTADPLVPYAWAQATVQEATDAGLVAILVTWPGDGHVPYLQHRAQILNKTRAFFCKQLDLTHALQVRHRSRKPSTTEDGRHTDGVEHFQTTDGVAIAYEVRGDGVPVIVCHGGPSTTHGYLVDDLAVLEGCATLVFHDYRGSGASAAAPTASYTFERLADDVDELRQHLGFDDVVLLAHSMGGFVAIQYALRHAERCRSLVLVSVSPAGTVRRAALPTFRALGARRGLAMLRQAAVYVGWWSWRRPSDARTLAGFSIMGGLQQGRPEFRAAVAEREQLADNDNAAALERLGFRTDFCDELARIACPVLVIYGTHDAPFSAGAALLRSRLPHVETVAFAGVGHHPLVEEHERATRAIAEALAVTDAGGRAPSTDP